MSIPLFFPMENASNYLIHNAVKSAWKQFDAQIKARYQRYWCELLFESDDIEGYATDFLLEVNQAAEQRTLGSAELRALISRWHEDMIDHRSAQNAKKEKGSNISADDLFKELGV